MLSKVKKTAQWICTVGILNVALLNYSSSVKKNNIGSGKILYFFFLKRIEDIKDERSHSCHQIPVQELRRVSCAEQRTELWCMFKSTNWQPSLQTGTVTRKRWHTQRSEDFLAFFFFFLSFVKSQIGLSKRLRGLPLVVERGVFVRSRWCVCSEIKRNKANGGDLSALNDRETEEHVSGGRYRLLIQTRQRWDRHRNQN